MPIWVQKSFGPWTTYGGVGETIFNRVPGYRNFPYAGWLVQRDIGKKWTLGAETFYHGPEGLASAQTRDFGGYYKFRDPAFNCCSATDTRLPAKAKTTRTWDFIGLGATKTHRQPEKAITPRIDSACP